MECVQNVKTHTFWQRCRLENLFVVRYNVMVISNVQELALAIDLFGGEGIK